MSNNILLKKLALIRQEDFIWIIYFFIIIFALISNYFEKIYLIDKDPSAREKFSHINTTILIIAFFIYLYNVIISYDDLKSGKQNILSFLRVVASLLFLVAGAIFIYIDFKSNTTERDIEII